MTTETSSLESVKFLDVGTQLTVTPHIGADGLALLDIHPEVSSGVVSEAGLPSESTAELRPRSMPMKSVIQAGETGDWRITGQIDSLMMKRVAGGAAPKRKKGGSGLTFPDLCDKISVASTRGWESRIQWLGEHHG